MKLFSSFKGGVKAAWAASLSSIPPYSPDEGDHYKAHPYHHKDPLVSLLVSFLEKNTYPLMQDPDGLSISERIQFQILKYYYRLTDRLLVPFYHLQFPWLESDESSYDEEEAELSFLLIQKPPGWELKFLSADRYFQALLQIASQIQVIPEPISDTPHRLFHSSWYEGAFLFSSLSRSIGSLIFPFEGQSIEVRALGPQTLPFTDMTQFGIGPGADFATHWAPSQGALDTWFHYDWHEKENRIELEITPIGLHQDLEIAFSLYVKAPSIEIDGQIIQLRSLHRYDGEVKSILIGGFLNITGLGFTKLKIIPLAGEKSFWNSNFLLAFTFPSHDIKSVLSFCNTESVAK
jgi:hypothetical protein